jgi:hypothetical protein
MSATADRIVSGQRDAPPATPIRAAPVFVWPPQPIAVFRFLVGLPGYFLPLNILYMGLAILTWFALTPELARMANFQWDWIVILSTAATSA